MAPIIPGLDAVMSLEWDPESEILWAGCDNNCNNRIALLKVDSNPGETQGTFIPVRTLDPPAGLANGNHEGIAIGPSSAGTRAVLWAQDGGGAGSSLWRGELVSGEPCP